MFCMGAVGRNGPTEAVEISRDLEARTSSVVHKEYRSDTGWHAEWGVLLKWGAYVSARYGAAVRTKYFAQSQYGRLSALQPFSKGRILRAAWMAGASVAVTPHRPPAPRSPTSARDAYRPGASVHRSLTF